MTPIFDYGTFDDVRAKTVQKFGSFIELPIIRNANEIAISYYREGNILDIGAGKNKPFFKSINEKIEGGKYYSLDNDPQGEFDFSTLEEIPSDLNFSLVIANQFFEHLEYQDAINFTHHLSKNISEGGNLIVSVPNILHPNRYWGDITHLTHWNYNNLSLIYHYAGLEVTKIARYSKRHPRGLIEKLIAGYITRIYRMDWCDSIAMVGVKS